MVESHLICKSVSVLKTYLFKALELGISRKSELYNARICTSKINITHGICESVGYELLADSKQLVSTNLEYGCSA